MRLRGVTASAPIYGEVAELVRRFPAPYGVRWVDATLGSLAWMHGEWDRALEYGEHFLAIQPGVPTTWTHRCL